MAALQTLRNKPALLMSVIGGALLLFIVTLTDLNSCSNPNIEAEVNGQELTYQDFEQQVQDEENLQTMLQGSITDDQKDQIRETVWRTYIANEMVSKEADALGLSVTKEEIQNALSSVNMNALGYYMQMIQQGQMSVAQLPYAAKIMILMSMVGQPTVEGYKQFIKTADQQIAQSQKQNPEMAEAIAKIKRACLYCEKRIPQELLSQKYYTLLECGMSSNPISAQMAFEENNTSYDLEMASIPYSSIEDKDIKFTDNDLKNKYEEIKPLFRINSETRDMKFINVVVTPSTKDQETIMASVKSIEDSLKKVSDAKAVENIMKSSKTDISYNNVFLAKEAFNELSSISSALDSMSIGALSPATVEPRYRNGIQYVNTFKLVGKKSTPDSMQGCQFAVDSKQLADSLITAVKGGDALNTLAKKYPALIQKYNAQGDTTWIETKYYVNAKAGKDSTANQCAKICQIPAGTTTYYTQTGPDGKTFYVVASVISTKASSDKYNVAIMRTPMKFSTETYNNQRRQLFEFLAKNKTIDAIEKNAPKAGYTIIEQPNLSTTNAMDIRYNIGGEGAKQAFIWAFDEAEAGNVSPVYECGKNNDQLLVVCVDAINEGKYREWDNANVRQTLEMLVKQDKKAEKIMSQTKNVKNFTAAKSVKGAQVQTMPTMSLAQITQSEPALAGVIQRIGKGKFSGAVKGITSIYMVQITNKTTGSATFKQKEAMAADAQNSFGQLFGRDGNTLFRALQNKMKIMDKRYKF